LNLINLRFLKYSTRNGLEIKTIVISSFYFYGKQSGYRAKISFDFIFRDANVLRNRKPFISILRT